MPFTVTAKETTNTAQGAQQPASPRDRAIQAFNKAAEGLKSANNSGQPPVNANAISPEDLSAITARQQTQTNENTQQTSSSEAASTEQKGTNENPSEATSGDSKPPLSAQYAQLARKEKQLRAQVLDIKAKEAEIAKREQALTAKDSQYTSDYISKAKLAEDLIGTLTEAGLFDYDKITQGVLNQPSQGDSQVLAELRAVKAELKSLKSESEGTKKSITENQTQQYQQAVRQIRKEAELLTESDPAYETIKATGNIEEVVKLIQKTFDEDGYLMTVEDAAQEIENELVEEISKYSSLSKIQKKLGAKTPSAQQQNASVNSSTQQQTSAKTLSNSMSTSKPMTARERAIAAFEGKKAQG